jgi:TRAP-type transport system periplasmic protein
VFPRDWGAHRRRLHSIRAARGSFVVGSAAAYATAGFGRGAATAAQFEFKCASGLPGNHPTSVHLTEMWATIEQESGGRIHTQFFPNGQLGGESALFTQLRVGAVTFFLIAAPNIASVVPMADICFLGFAFKDPDEGLRAMNGALGGYLRDEIAAKELHALRSLWGSGMFEIGSNSHPIRTPDDLQGFKIRVSAGKINVDLFKTLGASPLPLNFTEVYTSLQTKIIDGTSTPLVTMETARLYEVQKYISLTNHGWSGLMLIANGDSWKSLPPDLQEIVERNNTKYAALENREIKAGEVSVAAQLMRQGVLINQVDQTPFRTRLRSYYEYWANAFGPRVWGALENSLGRKLI